MSEGHVPDGCHIDGYGRVRKNRTGDRDPPEQEDRPQHGDMYWSSSSDRRQRDWVERGRPELGGRYAPDRYAPDDRTPGKRYDGHLLDEYCIDKSGRVRLAGWEKDVEFEHPERRDQRRRRGGEVDPRENDELARDSAPAEPSVRKMGLGERFDLAKSNLQKARAEFEGARTLIQSEIRDLPPPVTEDAKGVAAAQKLIRRTRALTDAIQEYKATYERARKAGLTEGGEKTADFTDREDDGCTEEVWAEIKAAGRARVPEDWDGLHMIPEEATPTRQELDISLMMLLSPRLGEDAHHLAAASTRYRKAIDALIKEGHNLREANSFPKAEADKSVVDEPVVEEPVVEEPVAEEPVVDEPVVE